MNIYIQSLNNFPMFDWGVDALMGFKMKGANIQLYEDIEEVPFNRYSMVVASIEDTRKFFEGVGYKEPETMTMPEEIIKYAGRNIKLMTFEEAMMIDDYPFFIKPYSVLKNFESGVIERSSMKTLYSPNIDKSQIVMISDVVDFITEYRGYVINKELVGLKHYKGDIRVFPDVSVIDNAINDYKNQPKAYSIDFGVTSAGETLLVECNDGWSLGNYGLSSKLYSSLLIARWREIIEQNPIK